MNGKTFDTLLMFADINTTATDATALPNVVDLGTGLVVADLVVDVATSTGANSVTVELSNDGSSFEKSFTFPIVGTGRYVIPFRNQIGDINYGHMRIVPTVVTSLVLGAFAAKQ